MSILVHVDMEGSASVWKWNQIGLDASRLPKSCSYRDVGVSVVEVERAREAITREVNAVVEGILASGRVPIVWDTHGPGCVRPDVLHPDAQVAIGKGGPFLGNKLLFNDDVEAMLIVGQHCMAGTEGGNLAHTNHHPDWVDRVMLNGKPVGEFTLRAMLAGRFNIPTILVTGDDLTCQEAIAMNPDIVTAEVKKSAGVESALCLSARNAQALIKEKTIEAIGRIGSIDRVWQDGPYELRQHFTETAKARAHVERRGGRVDVDQLTVIAESDDYLDVAM